MFTQLFALYRRATVVMSFACLLTLLVGFSPWSRWTSARHQTLKSSALTTFLNPDGTLKAGTQGSFDASGYRMSYGAGGAPVFTQASDNLDDNWDSRFSISGPNGSVNAIAVSGNDVYVGGGFSTAGGVSASGIAKWNGVSWSALGSGVDSGVLALAVSGNDVYAGGEFTTAGGVSANNIARWNGVSWSALGSGVNNRVNAIAVSGSEVYVGGWFRVAGGVSASHIAKWNGASWSPLGSGVSGGAGDVYALAVSGSELYVGGAFSTAGNLSANSIAKWNGVSWSALGSGVSALGSGFDSVVFALAVSGSDVYAGGNFTTAGGASASNIAMWNGTAWSSLGSGVNGGVRAIAVSGQDVYAGGDFNAAGNVDVKNVAKWNGVMWSALADNANDPVYALAVSSKGVYGGGSFTYLREVGVASIALWNGASWQALDKGGQGILGSLRALAVSGQDIYVGGFFNWAGQVKANRVAKWNGTSWSTLGMGLNGSVQVHALAVSGNDLYVGGVFDAIGGLRVNNIAKWNGSAWARLGGGVGPSGYSGVYAIAASGPDVYVAGIFDVAGGLNAKNIAKWNGTSWSALGNGMNNSVAALALSGNDLYVGGAFTATGDLSASHIAKWNGTSWSALGSGLNNYASAMALSGSDLYVGGAFTTAGGAPASHIAKWNGTSWLALSRGVGGVVSALAIGGSDVYAGGSFTTAGGAPASNIAKWNGVSWSALGSGIGPYNSFSSISGLVVSGRDLYAGGSFTSAGNRPSNGFGRYRISAGTPPTISATTVVQRQQGDPGIISTIAGVRDADTASGSLSVAAMTVPAGITISFITNTNGLITARIAVDCNATMGANTLVLAVSDGALTATANLTVNVSANTPPLLGVYANTTLTTGIGTTVTPNAAPSDRASVASVSVSGVTGATVNATTGAVTIPNTLAAGSYTATVKATDNCGAIATTSFTVTVNAAQPTGQCATMPTGLLAWYRGEGNANASTGAINGVLLNGATFAAGKVGQAFSFDGVNDAVSFGNALGNFGTADFAADFWLKTTATRTEAVISKRAVCDHASFWDVRVLGGKLYVELDQAGGVNYNLLTSVKTVNDGVYHHVALVRQGATVRLYVDGALDKSQTTAAATNLSNTANLMLGTEACINVDATKPFSGQLDELVLYNRALTAGEIQSIFNAGSAGVCAMDPPTNTAPVFATLSPAFARQQGSPAGNALTIATVFDAQTAAGNLTVTATTIPAGLFVTGITNANGVITAQVAAGCNATIGANTVVLRVSDGALSATANLTVNVTANTPPALSYTPVTLTVNENATISPLTLLSDNGTVSAVSVRSISPTISPGGFTGTVSVNTSGVVSITGAGAPGVYTVTIRATDDCGAFTDVPLSLKVLGQLVINEFRLSGPGGANDWYVEVYNNSNVPVSTTGLKLALANQGGSQQTVVDFTPARTIAAHGYYLIAGSAYSLGITAMQLNGVMPDQQVAALPFSGASGAALFANTTSNSNKQLDAVGQVGLVGAQFPYYEGTPVPFLNATTAEHAFVRKFSVGDQAQDTQNNVADFVLVATSGNLINGNRPVIGAPGPQNSVTPLINNAGVPVTLFAPAFNQNSAPNLELDATPINGLQGNYPAGSLTLRRTVTNNTGAPIRRLRLRITELSNGAATGQANLRVIDAADVTINGQTVLGAKVESLPAQPLGGGFNSTLTIPSITLAQPIPAGGSVNVQFRFGVLRGGSYRFYFNLEPAN